MSDYTKMRKCSYMLPDPGGEVVRELLDDITTQQATIEAQSELIQHEWASPYELAGLKSEIEKLRKELDSRANDSVQPWQLSEADSTMLKSAGIEPPTIHLAAGVAELCEEIERLREELRIESEEAMSQKARADSLELELVSVEIIASALLSKCGQLRRESEHEVEKAVPKQVR